eukprot:CAMPEP_0172529610 /NCGR_PEP_ID=MMETSP1067-20121228/3655_1 /TAXON_ID=265564 ORGANISM="Thalassiosira punctigera, Strain Tpunct2005C2" /NCGR_SAMPLE_ID=MMETSP1067 /ASSEMBLY_ACC=CAM_ASM_000444 /LENGTH=288 /DNA_ID=CAMNT_0013313699 /DNA_START=21 /DNA_END=887 /DNA_ORIENTATION=+
MTVTDAADEKQQYLAPEAVPVVQAEAEPAALKPVNAQPAVAAAVPHLQVVAPATLAEGYTFEAEANGQRFTVKVPEGGVEKGQTFSVPFPASSDGYVGSAIPHASAPVGHWKDDLFGCCRHGVMHPSLWNAWCCPLILAGQILHRLKLTWLAREGTDPQVAATFRILVYITLGFLLAVETLKYVTPYYTDEYGYPTSNAGYALVYGRSVLELTLSAFTIFLVARTRKRIREKYAIPEQQCVGCEDCCCSFWCNCCTVAQMARHTADYDTYAGLCCSETGMPPHAPSVV